MDNKIVVATLGINCEEVTAKLNKIEEQLNKIEEQLDRVIEKEKALQRISNVGKVLGITTVSESINTGMSSAVGLKPLSNNITININENVDTDLVGERIAKSIKLALNNM